MRPFLRQLMPGLVLLGLFTVICGVVYPLVVTAVAQTVFADEADGSIVSIDGQAVGSRLIGQAFTAPEYFHPRPSAAGYDGLASGGSNLGPTNRELLTEIEARVFDYRAENGLPDSVEVPVDAVTSSASGLDPHISIANAELQAPRVAEARGVPVATVLALVEANTDAAQAGFLNDPGVNVLELNLALDRSH